ITRGPFGLNLDYPHFAQGVMTKAAPFPLGGFFYQALLYRIKMDVSQLLVELCRIANVAVIVAFLPERTRVAQALRKGQLKKMHGVGQSVWSRFADQQMNVFGHDDITVNAHPETQPHAFEAFEKKTISVRRRELAVPLITTEGEEMRLAGFVESFQPARHTG